MATIHTTKRYSGASSIYAPQVISDYLNYKGNPTVLEYRLPIECQALGCNVIIKTTENDYVACGKSNQIMYYGAYMFTPVGYLRVDDINSFPDNEIVFNYTTSPFTTFVPARTTGTAYRIRKQSFLNDSGKYYPGWAFEKIGSWADVRNQYDNQAVVLTGFTSWENTGGDNRVKITANTYSVSQCFGRRAYDINGGYIKNSSYNQTTEGGFFLLKQNSVFSVKKAVGMYTTYHWYDQYVSQGADIILFDTGDTDKTGQRIEKLNSNCFLAIIFPSKKDVSKIGNQTGVPFVIDDENKAKTGDIDDFPDYDKPGVPDNETGGGDGLGDNTNDKMDEPKNPDLSPIAAGNNLYAMTQAELEDTFNFLWDGHNKDILGTTVSEANIIDTLCNCFYMPFDIVSHDSAHCVEATVTAGGYASEVNSKAIISGYNKRFNFGDLEINEYYGSYLDYAPYTTITIYLPYIGFKQLDVSKCMGKKINVTYSVDFSQGIVTAYISYYYDGNKQVFAEFSGQIGIPIKVTGKNTTAAENAVKDAAFAVGGFALAAISVLAVPATGGTSLIGTAGAVGAGVSAIGKTVNAMTVQPNAISIGNAGAENWLL